jgi:hypothetical protein
MHIEATGVTSPVIVGRAYYEVDYVIRGGLLGKIVNVNVVNIDSREFFFLPGFTSGQLAPRQISGPRWISLTTQHLVETRVDFELVFVPAPR